MAEVLALAAPALALAGGAVAGWWLLSSAGQAASEVDWKKVAMVAMVLIAAGAVVYVAARRR